MIGALALAFQLAAGTAAAQGGNGPIVLRPITASGAPSVPDRSGGNASAASGGAVAPSSRHVARTMA